MAEEHKGPKMSVTDLLGFCEHLQMHLDAATEAARTIKEEHNNQPDPEGEEIDTIGKNLTSLYMEADDLTQQLAMMVQVAKMGGPEAMIRNLGSWGREDN